MKALKVPTLLEGEALASWLELTEEEQADFKTLKKKLIAKLRHYHSQPWKSFTLGSYAQENPYYYLRKI